MGIDANTLRFLALARQTGVDFSQTLTIGRQPLYVAPEAACARPSLLTRTPSMFFVLLGRAWSIRLIDRATRARPFSRISDAVCRWAPGSIQRGPRCRHARTRLQFSARLRNCMALVAPGGHLLVPTVSIT